MTSKMDEIFKRVLNDKDIFWIKKEIYKKDEWSELKKKKDDVDSFTQDVDRKIESLKIEKDSNKEDKDIEEALKLCERLKSAIMETPNIMDHMFNLLTSYGVVKSNLPNNMDDYGKVIERYDISLVEQFFLDKIKREKREENRKALRKVLEYVKELYNANISPLEIAYFVRKLDSLKIFWEV